MKAEFALLVFAENRYTGAVVLGRGINQRKLQGQMIAIACRIPRIVAEARHFKHEIIAGVLGIAMFRLDGQRNFAGIFAFMGIADAIVNPL